MSEESKTPHGYLAPGDDRFTMIEGGKPLTKEQAIEALRRSAPKEIANVPEVELATFPDDGPTQRLGKVRVRYSMGDLIRSQIGASFTFTLPTGKL